MEAITPPYFPIVYVRGYAMLESDIADTVATPYMGFNDGSMKERDNFDAKVVRHAFESPLVRLRKDWDYHDLYDHGDEWAVGASSRIIAIHRYYDQEDIDLGEGKHQTVLEAAKDLGRLILDLRDHMYGKEKSDARDAFGVHLVAHSMGGLICRALLQNDAAGKSAKRFVRRVFTYATPHNGISFRGWSVPGFLSWLGFENQFSHKEMKKYLEIKGNPKRVDTLQAKFPARQFFCLVGTNHADYNVAFTASRKAAGPRSDGLVAIDNARLKDEGVASACVHRSHSGHFGIVNSEAGYQNLVDFLFAEWRIDGGLKYGGAPRPPSLGGAPGSPGGGTTSGGGGKGDGNDGRKDDGTDGDVVQTAHQIEVAVTPLGSTGFRLTERRIDHGSAIVLRESQLVALPGATERPSGKPVELFTTFAGEADTPVEFNVALWVSPTEYAVNGRADPRRFIPDEYLFQDTIRIRLERADETVWMLRYVLTNQGVWGETVADKSLADIGTVFEIPLETPKFSGTLRIEVTRMTDEPAVRASAQGVVDKDSPSGGGEQIGERRANRGKWDPKKVSGHFTFPSEDDEAEKERKKKKEEEEEKKEKVFEPAGGE